MHKKVGFGRALAPCEAQRNPAQSAEPEFQTFKEPRSRFQGIDPAGLCSLAGRFDNPIPTRFLALHSLFSKDSKTLAKSDPDTSSPT